MQPQPLANNSFFYAAMSTISKIKDLAHICGYWHSQQ